MKRQLVLLVPGILAAAAMAQPYDLPEHRAEFEAKAHRGLLARMQGWDPEAGVPYDIEANRVCAKERTLRAYFEAGLTPQGPIGDRGPGPVDPTDVLNNTLDLEVSPPGNGLSGSNTMTIRSNVNGLSSFTFMLRWNFTVTRCTVTDSVGSYDVTPTFPNSAAVPPTYARTFSFLRPLNTNEVFTVRVEYNGALQSGIGLGSIVYGGQNGTATNPGVLCTLSEPYYAATWWPCKDGDVRMAGDNGDKATLNASITAPNTFKSVSNGVLQGVDVVSGNRLRYRWATSYPLSTYLVMMSTSAYNVFNVNYNHPGGTMPLDFYIYPINDTPANRAVWNKIPDMLAALRPVYGEYPFINEKYGIYQFEFGGGMEHQTFTGQGGGGAFNEGVTAHELGHQWWGDNVTCKTWSDIWLNEGFATYTEALWEERRPGSTGLPALKTAMFNRRPSDANGTVWIAPFNPADPNNLTNNTGNAGRIFSTNYSYRKAGWVLHMLRKIVGDAAFFNTLQAHRAAGELGARTTAEFTATASAIAGQDLSWFFNPWLYNVGAPAYQYGWAPVTINGNPYARVMIKQIQTTGPIFDMPVDLRLNTNAGSQIALVNVRNSAATQHYLIPLSTVVGTVGGSNPSVVLDPDGWVLEYGKTIVAYVQGPPKIISTVPFAGLDIESDASPSSVSIGFSDPVTVSAAHFAVTRNGSPVPFTLSYNGTTQTATLTFSAPLTPGSYAVGVSDSVRSATGSIALDGELTLSSEGFATLPSGNGLAGGAAAFGFTVLAGCAQDINGDGEVSVQDIFDFLAAYFAGNMSADFNADTTLSVQDLFDFLAAYFAGCP